MDDVYEKMAALQSPKTMATVVHAIVRQQYGDDAYAWDPATIYLELRDDFRAEPATEVMDRWNAMQVVMTSDTAFKHLDAFLTICNTLATGSPFFQTFDPVTTEEAAWAITEMALNREPLEFSPTIKRYLVAMLENEGFEPAQYPTSIRDALELKRIEPVSNSNTTLIEQFVDDQLKDMVYQFNKIPSLHGVKDVVLARSMDEFLTA